MNYYYMEYMIREQRREETKACNRWRMLKGADYLEPDFLQELNRAVSRAIRSWKEQVLRAARASLRFCFRINSMMHQKGGIV